MLADEQVCSEAGSIKLAAMTTVTLYRHQESNRFRDYSSPDRTVTVDSSSPNPTAVPWVLPCELRLFSSPQPSQDIGRLQIKIKKER
jgi:hypothetical protein